MPSLRIPTPLRPYSGGQEEVTVRGDNVSEAMRDLVRQYPELKTHLFNSDDTLRPFVNLFLGEENVRDLQGMNTPINEDDRLLLLPSIAGGRGTGELWHWSPSKRANTTSE